MTLKSELYTFFLLDHLIWWNEFIMTSLWCPFASTDPRKKDNIKRKRTEKLSKFDHLIMLDIDSNWKQKNIVCLTFNGKNAILARSYDHRILWFCLFRLSGLLGSVFFARVILFCFFFLVSFHLRIFICSSEGHSNLT